MESLLDPAPLRHVGYHSCHANWRAVFGMIDPAVDDDRAETPVRPANATLEVQGAGLHCRIEISGDGFLMLDGYMGEQGFATPLGRRTGIAKDLVMARRAAPNTADEVG